MNIFSRSASPKPNNTLEDELARESDVTVSNIKPSSKAEYKGFSVYVLSSIVLLIYIFWSLLPDELLHKLSIDYYPDKYWAIVIPSYSLMLMVFIYIFLALYNTEILTLPLNNLNTILDENSQFPGEIKTSDRDELMNYSIDYIHNAPSGVWDLPISLVNEVLYNQEENGE
ncbi:unnamed protein product [Candida verbasci]|uniref:Phosphatidylinositol N-acetylglucosaminyltransferase subunit GPI19 n=1 Tax=Candida verbasci TaxID=1227364 RepID=A0A9W4XCK3_9ASCO|nr:unnamed protein product [Candida verbasci]